MMEFDRHDAPIRVRYSETDQMGHAYYANYLIWFEAARGHLMRAIDCPYGGLEAEGFLLPVTRFWARLSAPARYDEEIHVRLWIVALRSRAIEFYYQVWRQNDFLAEGGTTHVSVDRAGRPVRLPAAAVERLLAYQKWRPLPAGVEPERSGG